MKSRHCMFLLVVVLLAGCQGLGTREEAPATDNRVATAIEGPRFATTLSPPLRPQNDMLMPGPGLPEPGLPAVLESYSILEPQEREEERRQVRPVLEIPVKAPEDDESEEEEEGERGVVVVDFHV